MGFWRVVQRTFFLGIVVVPSGVTGTVIALGWTPPGRRVAGHLASGLLSRSMDGDLRVGAIEGNLITGLVLRDVTLHDGAGRTLVDAARVAVQYHLTDLYRGRLVFRDVAVDSARIHLVQQYNGQWNYAAAFGAAPSDSATTSHPPLVQLHDVTLRQVDIRVDVPAEPHPPAEPISRHATPPAEPRIEMGPDGTYRVYTLRNLAATLPLIRVSTPDEQPILVQITALETTVSDPAITLHEFRGEILTAGDSLTFRVERAVLPGSVVAGAGALRWPQDTVQFDFALTADTVDLVDLRWISPDFPAWRGAGRVVAQPISNQRTAYRFEALRLSDGRAQLQGELTALVDATRGLGFSDLAVTLRDVPLAIARPYLDTLPFDGTLSGRLAVDGFMDAMRLDGDLRFTDALAPGRPTSHFVIDGAVRFGGDEGAVFDRFRLDRSTVAMATVQGVVPAVPLSGTLGLTGTLDGPWTQVRFAGVTEHLTPEQAQSRMIGSVMLDTRDTILAVAIDATFDQLSFDGLRSGWPDIPARGGVTGHLLLTGRLDALQLATTLTGEIGTIRADGGLRLLESGIATDSLRIDFTRVDLNAVRNVGEETALTGRVLLRGRIDSAGPPEGSLSLVLDHSRVGAFPIENVVAQIRADSGLALIDTLQADLPGGWVDINGTLGLDDNHVGRLRVDAGFFTLARFDSLVRARAEIAPDTVLTRPLDGTIHGNFAVTGSIADLSIDGLIQARDLVLDRWRIAGIVADVVADSLGAKELVISADGDSLGHGDQIIERTRLRVSGRRDSLRIGIDGGMYQTFFAGLAHWRQQDSTAGQGTLDSLALTFPRQAWRLAERLPLAFRDGRPLFEEPLLLETRDGSGEIRVAGALPGRLPGTLTVSATGVDIHDLVSTIQRDSSTLSGFASLDLTVDGTAAAPRMQGTAALTAAGFGATRLPMLRATMAYQDQRLTSELQLWKTGAPLVEVVASVPFDLAFSATGPRRRPGELMVTARADSADLGLLEAFTSDLRRARGRLDLDLRTTGSWEQPRLEGEARIRDAAMILPSLGAEYTNLDAWLRFVGDSMVIDTLQLRSDGGHLRTTGHVRFRDLASPQLDLQIRTDEFGLMDVPGLFTLRPSGTVALRGPLLRPVLTGQVALARSIVHYADLVSKQQVDLSDTAFADLVDTAAIRRLGIGRSFQNRFFDSLQVDSLRFRVDQDVWLRSAEANILLSSDGEVRVSKQGREYRVDGEFNVDRGTYALTFYNLVQKTFKVDRGTVTFYNTADLNADLALEASHRVRTQTGEDLPVVASITGTLLAPLVDLSSPGRSLPSRDLITYLYFGVPAAQVNTSLASDVGLAAATSFVASTVGQRLSSETGVGVELTGIGSNRTGAALSRQLGNRAFVTLSGSVCSARTSGASSSLSWGASLEYRLAEALQLRASRSPIETCLLDGVASLRYQYGTDLLWRREY